MNELLLKFLRGYKELPEHQIQELAGLLRVVEYKKNTILVKEAQHCNLCFFVLRGCLRQYVLKDGLDKTIELYTENQAVNYYSNQASDQKSESYLISVEDCVLIIGDPANDSKLFARYPVLAALTRSMIEEDFGKTQHKLARLITSSPEQRYLSLLHERPNLLQRVPLHVLASYLGITPESLSRIRKRLASKKSAKL